MFFNFLSGPRLTSKFAKSANIIYEKQKLFFNNAIWVSKTQNFKLILNPLKKLQKTHAKKVKVTEMEFLTVIIVFDPKLLFSVNLFAIFFNGFDLRVKFCV